MQRLEVSGAVQPLYGSLGVKGLKLCVHTARYQDILHTLQKLFNILWGTEQRRGDCDSTVIKVLCYKSEGRWFDPSWCQR